MKLQKILGALVCAFVAAILAACGGTGGTGASGPSGGRGSLQFGVEWPIPTPDRLIPITSQSVRFVVKSTVGTVLATPPLVTKPSGTNFPNNTTSVTITGLPAGPVVVSATAFPQQDGGGVAQATATMTVTVVAGITTTAPDVIMNTTITNVVLTPSATNILPGGQITVSASARDANNNAVFIAPEKLSGAANDSSGNPAFTISRSGSQFTLKALAIGTFIFKVTETESGVTGDKQNPLAITVGTKQPPNVVVLDITNSHDILGLSDAAPGAALTSFKLGNGVVGQDLAVDKQFNVFVAEMTSTSPPGGRIVEMTAGGTVIGQFDTPGIPNCIYVDAQGQIYWYDTGPNLSTPIPTINRVDNINGYPETLRSARVFVNPITMTSDGQFLYVLDGSKNGIIAGNADLSGSWNPQIGAPPMYGSKGSGRDQFDLMNADRSGGALHGLALHVGGTFLYIADYNNSRIVRVSTGGFRQPDFSNTGAFNFKEAPLSASETNGANFFKPISVAVDDNNQHVFFTGIEVKDKTMSDSISSPNIVNSFVGRIDVFGLGSGQASNLSLYGGATTSAGGGVDSFGPRPRAVGAR